VGAVREAADAIDAQVVTTNGITQGMVDQAGEASEVVSRLEHNLRNVAGMARLISGVADQTKLLALNATIEAARAGEAGRGFSVVADEVKQLATETAGSTEQIAATVSSLEADAGAMLTAVTGVGGGVGDVTGTTAALAEVAREQRMLVDRLDKTVGDALTRIRSMGSVTERLERREAERLPVNGVAEVHRDGATHAAELNDLSATGARLVADGPLPVRQGEVVRIVLPLGHEVVTVDAEIVRDRRDAGGQELGIRFVRLDPAEAARIEAFLETAAAWIESGAGD
jgi:methyl-accepting chemotaxis protein